MSDEDDSFDDTFEEDERREAEALAHALERGAAKDALPQDALQTAALIRYSADGGALTKEREDAVLADVLAAADRAVRSREPRKIAWWQWALGLTGVALAAVLVMVIVRPEEAGAPTALPAPSPSLLEAQLAQTEGSEDGARFDDEMGRYRGAVYAALEARYGAR
jgi:hypothetical protein